MSERLRPRPRQYALINGEVEPCDNLLEWASNFEHSDRRVLLTEMPPEMGVGRDGLAVSVSTVFLGLDHAFSGPPLLFETMIFGGEHSDRTWRYSTLAEAKDGHDQIVNCLIKHLPPEVHEPEEEETSSFSWLELKEEKNGK